MLTIGQVASKTGLRASAIRYYETEGLLPVAPRVGGKRVYERAILKRLAVIELAKTAGFSLNDIRIILSDVKGQPHGRWRKFTGAKRQDVDREMSRLRLMRLILSRLDRCRCASLDDCGRLFEVAAARYRETRAAR